MAAPGGPVRTQLVCRRTARIWSRSTASRLGWSCPGEGGVAEVAVPSVASAASGEAATVAGAGVGRWVGVDVECQAGREDNGALEDVFQLPEVARPGLVLEPPHCRVSYPVEALAEARGKLLNQELDPGR
jgi:hypothetical protein